MKFSLKFFAISLLLFSVFLFISCGEEKEEEKRAEDATPPELVSIDIADGEEIPSGRSITAIFSEEMSWVNIVVAGATGKTILDSTGKIAVWVPSGNIAPGDHKITISGQDKAGNNIKNYKPISFQVTSKLNGKKIQAIDFWFPGDINSQWVYNIPGGDQVTNKVSKYLNIGGKTYKVVEESDLFLGIIEKPASSNPDPFLTFRESDSNQVLGYGVAGNKVFEGMFIDMLKEIGFDEKSVKVSHKYSEWILLDRPEMSYKWTIMQMTTKISLPDITINGIFEIKGYISQKEKLITEAGEFETYVVEYTAIDEVEGDKAVEPVINLWLSPDVGLIKMEGDNSVLGRLSKYKIVSNKPAPASYVQPIMAISNLMKIKKEIDINLRKNISKFVNKHKAALKG